jgi:hypothetical protein
VEMDGRMIELWVWVHLYIRVIECIDLVGYAFCKMRGANVLNQIKTCDDTKNNIYTTVHQDADQDCNQARQDSEYYTWSHHTRSCCVP